MLSKSKNAALALFPGVRPSSGAAMSKDRSDFARLAAGQYWDVAAAGDGRTPYFETPPNVSIVRIGGKR
jgi:membrane glycosyltransferase